MIENALSVEHHYCNIITRCSLEATRECHYSCPLVYEETVIVDITCRNVRNEARRLTKSCSSVYRWQML